MPRQDQLESFVRSQCRLDALQNAIALRVETAWPCGGIGLAPFKDDNDWYTVVAYVVMAPFKDDNDCAA